MAKSRYDAILILGGSINLDGSLPAAAKSQVDKALELLHKKQAKVIITCGLYGYKDKLKPCKSEAEAYAQYAMDLGISSSGIYTEEHSMETLGNVLFAKINVLIPNQWHNILIIPNSKHSTERIEYIARKVLGLEYKWRIERAGEITDKENVLREKKTLLLSRGIQDKCSDGDHDAILAALISTHPAYGGNRWTIEELRQEVGQYS